MAVQIQLTGTAQGYLTVAENTAVPVNLSVSDIKDLSKKRGGFTKTVIVKGDKASNQLLGQLFDTNIETGDFDRRRKTPAVILQDGIPVLEGNLRLLSVNKMGVSNDTWDQEVEYEVSVTDDTATFYQALGELELRDIDFSDLDHVYTAANVTGSITNDWTDGYKYVWPGSGDNQYDLEEFKPGIYAIQYWDRIFDRAGYTYTWSTKDADTIQMSKLLIPYNGGIPTLTAADTETELVRAFTTAQTITTAQTAGTNTSFVGNLVVDSELQDFSSRYNPLTGTYTNPFYLSTAGNRVTYEFVITYRLVLRNQSGATAYLQRTNATPTGGNAGFTYSPYLKLAKNGVVLSSPSATLDTTTKQSSYITQYTLPVGDTTIDTNTSQFVTFATTGNYIPGDLFTNKLGITINQSNIWNTATWKSAASGGSAVQVDVAVIVDTISMNIVPNIATVGYNSFIRMNSYIPEKIKQRDYIKSICTMFNLYVENDTEDPNNLIIKRRDDYYDGGAEYNWTSKLSLDQESTIQFGPELASGRVTLSYKDGADTYNTSYKNTLEETYGQVRYTFDDENVKGDQRVELIFEPTPIVKAPWGGFIHPVVGLEPKTGIRILYDGGSKTASTYTIKNYPGSTVSTTTYNYAGHYDDPIVPTFDINFGVCDYLFYTDWQSKTNDNLFNLHWRRTMGQINDGKLLSAYFDLDVLDINLLRLNDKIFVKDAWWNIQEVVDYDANQRKPTLVKLLSIDRDTDFAPFKTKIIKRPFKGDAIMSVPREKFTMEIVAVKNVSDGGTRNLVLGTSNYFGPDASGNIVMGGNNTVTGTGNVVTGNNVVVNGSGNIVTGDNITVDGSNQTVRASFNFIDAGSDEVLDVFAVTDINVVDAGLNAVLSIGSATSVTAFDAGSDTVI